MHTKTEVRLIGNSIGCKYALTVSGAERGQKWVPVYKHGYLHAVTALGIKVRESFWVHSHEALQIPPATAYRSDYYIQIKFKRERRVNISRQTCDRAVGALPPWNAHYNGVTSSKQPVVRKPPHACHFKSLHQLSTGRRERA